MAEFNLDKVKDALTRKIGPLPTWGWALVAVGGIWAWRLITKPDYIEETTGSMVPSTTDEVPFTPSPSMGGGGGYAGFETQANGSDQEKQITRVQVGTREGGYVDFEGPGSEGLWDQVKDVAETLTSAPSRTADPAPAQPEPDPMPKVDSGGGSSPKRQPDLLADYRKMVVNAYHTEGVKPPNAATILRIALEVKQGRSIEDLRQSIRNNEIRYHNNKTPAQSREYWQKKGYSF